MSTIEALSDTTYKKFDYTIYRHAGKQLSCAIKKGGENSEVIIHLEFNTEIKAHTWAMKFIDKLTKPEARK